MKKALASLKKLSKIDIAEIKAVINIDLKSKNFKDQESEFYQILESIDLEMNKEAVLWSRYDNQASINRNISITFTF